MFSEIKRRPRIVQESVIPTLSTLVEAAVGVAVVPWSASRARDSKLAFLPCQLRAFLVQDCPCDES